LFFIKYIYFTCMGNVLVKGSIQFCFHRIGHDNNNAISDDKQQRESSGLLTRLSREANNYQTYSIVVRHSEFSQ